MSTFGLPATCHHCGGSLELVSSAAAQVGTEARAVVRCPACPQEYLVAIQLRPITTPKHLRKQDRAAAASSSPDGQLDLLSEGA